MEKKGNGAGGGKEDAEEESVPRLGPLVTLVFLEIGGSHTSSHTRLDPGAGSVPLPVVRKPQDALARGMLISQQARRREKNVAPPQPWW